jgi:hypothetical protein
MNVGPVLLVCGLAWRDRRVHRLRPLQWIRCVRHVWFGRLFDHAQLTLQSWIRHRIRAASDLLISSRC